MAGPRTDRPGRRIDGPVVGLARLGEVDRGLEGHLVLAVLDDGLVRMALLPAGIALGELLLELPGVEEDERRQLDRAIGRLDRPAEARLDDVAG